MAAARDAGAAPRGALGGRAQAVRVRLFVRHRRHGDSGGGRGDGGSFEYLVFFSAFAALAASHGLDPVGRWPNPALERLLDPGDEGAAFKHFAPHFPGADPSLERASELFAAFVFRKREVNKAE